MSKNQSFAHRVVVVTGAASGIGGALTDRLVEAEAEVWTLDVAAVESSVAGRIDCDLGDPAAIDRAVAALPERVDMLFNCAGVPNGGRFKPAEIMAINWLGLRHLSEALVGRMPADQGSITNVASTAGRGWPNHVVELRALMAADDFAAGRQWVEQHPGVVGDGYSFSKEAVQWYTMERSLTLRADHGIRMNSICPGVTNTALAADFRRGVGDDIIDRAIEIAGRLAEPSEMVPALLFLAASETAEYINGINLNVDRGTGAAHLTGSW